MTSGRGSRPRVGLLVGAAQPVGGDVRVELGRGERGVAEELLDRPQVSPSLEEVGCGRVPQAVRSDVRGTRDLGDPTVDEVAHSALVDAPPSDTEEQRRTGPRDDQLRAAAVEPPAQCPLRRCTEGHRALLAALAEDPHQPAVVVDVVDVEPGQLTDPDAGVSAHYLITEDGEVIQLVSEAKRAWHAGASYWRGIKDVNSASIGIELDHPGHALGYRPYSDAQIDALIPLLARIVKQYDIPRANIVGHSDVAPLRKVDPGELFPWERLAEYGLALPRPTKLEKGDPFHNEGAFILALERFGYDITEGRKTIEAFERRWRPELIEGKMDAQLAAILWHLLLERDQGRAR